LAPTGKAVDVAMREGAGDEGMTIAKAVQSLRDDTLTLDCWTLVVVDEAGMVGTDDLGQLLTATTKAGAKTVLVGDSHQLAPVKARGGMFAQLCADLPWTQRLEEVWRMTNPDERTASLALRDGDPKAIRRAVDWYRRHDRLHCGDAITMAADAVDAYAADVQLGRDALLICDTTEMADALNQRLHQQNVDVNSRVVTVARGQRVSAGDLILTRRNDPTIELRNSQQPSAAKQPVRNGNRWRVQEVNPAGNRILARRLEDNTLAVFFNDYVRDHITLGYAVTVHSAQGVTADATHAVLSENSSRAMLYVAMTRGRHANTARIYERITGDHEYGHQKPDGTHFKKRGGSHEAAQLIRNILANYQPTFTAHDFATRTPTAELPERVRSLLSRRASATGSRKLNFQALQRQERELADSMRQGRARQASRGRARDYGIEY
jgi:ATP-dependent exoDNAse (exonuclease V) alpha subunit